MNTGFILYVRDQDTSTAFYQRVLNKEPALNVPGMTEFNISDSSSLGLMPEKGIKRLLGDKLSDPEKSNGVSRAELYLSVDDPQNYHNRVLENGGKELMPLQSQTWGDDVAYSLDLDGHVLAFAKKSI